jgi:hypothetical protein
VTEPLDVPPPRSPSPNTFSSIRLDAQELAALQFDEFVRVLVQKLADLKSQRAA